MYNTKIHHKKKSRMNDIKRDDIDAAVCRLNGLFYTMEDTKVFLSSTEFNKNNSTRFICWLISFNILSPNYEQWPEQLFNLYTKYSKMVKLFIKDINNPLSDVPSKSAVIIESDVTRGIHWFQTLAADLQLSDYYTSDAELRTIRMFAVMSHESISYSYTQGHDRYMFVNLLLGLDFVAHSGLTCDFAEAISFYLAREFISMTAISKYLDNVTETEDHFLYMDKEFAKVAPEIMHQLSIVGQSSIHFALRWELLLFADEYDIKRLLFLWDQILYEKKIYKKFLFALCVAHIQQIPPALPGEIMVEKIQTFRNWNVQKILSNTNNYLKTTKKPRFKLTYTVYVLIIIVFLLYFYYLVGKTL